MEGSKYIKESRDYISCNASSWYVRDSYIGTKQVMSMTFVNFIYKVHTNESGGMASDSDLIAEAIATITLDRDSARAFAQAIIDRVGTSADDSE